WRSDFPRFRHRASFAWPDTSLLQTSVYESAICGSPQRTDRRRRPPAGRSGNRQPTGAHQDRIDRRSIRSLPAAAGNIPTGASIGATPGDIRDARSHDGLDELLNAERTEDSVAILFNVAPGEGEVLVGKRQKVAGIDNQSPAFAFTVNVGFKERKPGGHGGILSQEGSIRGLRQSTGPPHGIPPSASRFPHRFARPAKPLKFAQSARRSFTRRACANRSRKPGIGPFLPAPL